MADTAQFFGGIIVSDTAANADIQMNSKTRPTIFPNVSGDLDLQIRSARNGVLQINNDNQGPVSIAAGNLQLQNLAVRTGTDMVVDANGNVGAQSSSSRYKDNVVAFVPDVNALFALEPKAFLIKGTGESGFGFLAEDLDAVGLRDLVIYDSEGRPDAIHYKLLSVYLIELAKRQRGEVAALEERIARLEQSLYGEPS